MPDLDDRRVLVLHYAQQRRRVIIEGGGLVHLGDPDDDVHYGRGGRRVACPHPQDVLAVAGLAGILTQAGRGCR